MKREAINELAQKFLNGTATAEEKELIHDWYAKELESDADEVVVTSAEEGQDEVKYRVYASVMKRLEGQVSRVEVLSTSRRLRLWAETGFRYRIGFMAAAAVIVIFFSVWIYFTYSGSNGVDSADSMQYGSDVNPGTNKATLTLADGKTIGLSEDKGVVVIEASKIRYSDHTDVSEALSLESLSHSYEMTSVSTPRGGMYQVVLPDGSRVWLNAASKISFPLQFAAQKRVVSLQGEAYFEVKKDPSKPFIVESPGQIVEVLGTHFNINSYENEGSVRTTLLEGSVRVGKPGSDSKYAISSESIVLRPNQQALSDASEKIQVREVNTDDVTDWKRGDFVFRGESLEDVMRKVSRWYDVDVSYASEELKSITVGGFVSRSRSISAVLELMERTGKLKFKIEGRKVFVSK